MKYDASLNLKIIGYGPGNVFTPGANHNVWSLLSRRPDADAMLAKMKVAVPNATLAIVDDATSRGVMVMCNDDSVGLWNAKGTIPDPASTQEKPLDPLVVNEAAGQLADRESSPVPPQDDLTKFALKQPLAMTYSNVWGYAQFAWR